MKLYVAHRGPLLASTIFSPLRNVLLALAGLILGATLAGAQTNVLIEQTVFDSSNITFLVRNPVAGSTNFSVVGSTNFTAWSTLPGATVKVVDNGHVQVQIPRPSSPKEFMRILATISTNDPDADGLPTEVELSLGTNPFKVDTDGDGFSDGVEVLAGTDPLNPNSYPNRAGVPVVTFTNSISIAVEGAGSHAVKVTFDRPFTGNLQYTVNARSSAIAGQDYQALSGFLPVNGTTAQIVVTPVDDRVVRPERTLFLDLTQVAGYQIGVRSTHAVRTTDDDGYWTGSLKDKYAERNFRLLITASNGISQASFVAGAGFDGLLVLTNSAPGTSISEGIIPAGVYAGVLRSNTAAVFSLSSPQLAAGSGGLFTAYVQLARSFDLLAVATDSAHFISPTLIVGTYTERIGVSGTTASYLDRTNTGNFALVHDLPALPTLTSGVSP